MSGDKKAEELLYKASLKEPFRIDIANIRKKYNIPPNGFNSKEKTASWRFENR